MVNILMVRFCPFIPFTISHIFYCFLCESEMKRWQIGANQMNGRCHLHSFQLPQTPSFPMPLLSLWDTFQGFWKFKCQALHFDNASGSSGIGLWIDSITPTHFIIIVYLFVINPNWLSLMGRFKTNMLSKEKFGEPQFLNRYTKERPFSKLNSPSTWIFI